MKQEIIYGLRPVVEALRSRRREVYEVLDASGAPEVAQLAAAGGVSIQQVARKEVEALSPGSVHQGVVARVGMYPYSSLREILDAPDPLVLVLDGVTDPRNLGALLRVADGAGASGVVIPKDRSAEVTAVAVKASAGASEHVKVARETNLRRAIDTLKKAGVWVYAAEGKARTAYHDLDFNIPMALVLGSEGRGVRRLVREGCDDAVAIPMCGAVGSLNVSVAAAVLLFEARRQRGCRT